MYKPKKWFKCKDCKKVFKSKSNKCSCGGRTICIPK